MTSRIWVLISQNSDLGTGAGFVLGAALVISGWGDLGSPGSNWEGSVDIQELGLVDLYN